MNGWTRRAIAARTLALACFCAGVAPARAAQDPLMSLHFLAGHWRCTSLTDGQTTRYTTTWEIVTGGRWLRGTNRSGASASEDLETYDLATKQWRIVDMEPNGSTSVLVSRPGASAWPIVTQSVYPDRSQNVTFERAGNDAYKLKFDFVMKGKHQRWEDDCART